MRRLTAVYQLAKAALTARVTLVNNNRPVVFDGLRENWDVWVRLSDPEKAMWQAIRLVEEQIKETWTDDDD